MAKQSELTSGDKKGVPTMTGEGHRLGLDPKHPQHQSLKTRDPEGMANLVLSLPADDLQASLVGLDLDQGGFQREQGYDLAAIIQWMRDFRNAYQARAKRSGASSVVVPSIALFADRLTTEETRVLRREDAVLFDRSLACNQDFQTFEQLLAHQRQGRIASAQATLECSPPRPMPPEGGINSKAKAIYNSYPAWMTAEELRKLLDAINS